MSTKIKIEPLPTALGARVTGIDLAEPVSAPDVAAITQAWLDKIVLVFPGQDITQEQQLAFAENFGATGVRARKADERPEGIDNHEGIMLVTNDKDENGEYVGSLPDGEMQFHTDGAHREYPYRATTLYAIRIPSRGGNTLFANLYTAYDTLSDEMKERIEDLETVCVYDYAATERSTIGDDPDLPRATHRLVKTHPDSGRKSLYVCRLMTEYIVGLDRKESEKLLVELIDHAERPEFIYAHEWTPGDLLIWDNRCLNHARTDFPAEEQRLLRRYTVSEPNAPIAN